MYYFKIAMVVATMIHCISGSNILSRRSLEDYPEASLKFALRSMEVGMNLEEQFEIDKRGFQLREEEACESCKPPTAPSSCRHGFTPKFESYGANCSCIVSYECCSGTCVRPTNNCKCGETYADTVQDCCNCPKIVCRTCPVKKDTCDNPCDVAEPYPDPVSCCTNYRCVRPPPTTQPPPNCNSTCQTVVTSTNECGIHTASCKCIEPPMCTPEKPPEKDCNRVVRVNFDGIFGCKEDNQTCQQCYYWKYVPDVPEPPPISCPSCKIKQYEKGRCGEMRPKCTCREISSCFPPKPDKRPCHTLVKKTIEDLTVCGKKGEKECVNCYRWVFEKPPLTLTTTPPPTCDPRCMYKRPKAQECGSGEDCICTPYDRDICHPKPKTDYKCFQARKVESNSQFMCADVETNLTCVRCYSYEYDKIPCTTPPPKKCLSCQETAVTTNGCGCQELSCKDVPQPDCRPPKPPYNPCYNDPKRINLNRQINEDGVCLDCFYYNVTKKVWPDKDICTLRDLPRNCYAELKENGRCGSIVTRCQRHDVPCKEIYGQGAKCPDKLNMVSLKSQCGQDRHCCVDCSKVVTSQPTKKYPDECYIPQDVTIHGKCKFKTYLKKECPNDHLKCLPCPNGGKRTLVLDECNCPSLECVGCGKHQVVDIQLLLDASNSIEEGVWVTLIEDLQTSFLDSVLSNPKSRMAIARFGTEYQQITSLSSSTNARSLDGYKGLPYMGRTHLASALDKSYDTFSKKLNGSTARKALVVITDGNANGPGKNGGAEGSNVREAAMKWTNVVDQIFALGFGDVDLSGLKAIAPRTGVDVVQKKPNYESLVNVINKEVVPKICDQPNYF